MSIDWRHLSQRKRTCLRTSLCEGSPVRTKLRKAPQGSQLLDLLLPRSRPLGFLPPLPPLRPLLCPPLMAVRLRRWIHKAAHRSLELRSNIHSHTPPLWVARPAPPRCANSTGSTIRPTRRSIHWAYTEGNPGWRPPIPRLFCDDILTVLANLPWWVASCQNRPDTQQKLKHITYRTLDADPAACAINRNKDRILEHLVQVLSEWIVASKRTSAWQLAM